MNFNQPNGIAAILMLASAAVFAADAHHDHPPAAAPAADHPAAPAKDAQAKDPAALAVDDHGKPAPAKKARKQARAKPLHKAPTHGTKTDTHADAHHPAPAAHGSHDANAAHGTQNSIAAKTHEIKTEDASDLAIAICTYTRTPAPAYSGVTSQFAKMQLSGHWPRRLPIDTRVRYRGWEAKSSSEWAISAIFLL